MLPLVKPYIAPRDEMMPAIEEILYSGYISEGEPVYKFEDEMCRFLEAKNAISTNSGTAAIHLALMLEGIGAGDEVISTALTAEPTNTTIALTGAKIVWADIDEKTGLLDPDSIREKITNKTKAIVVVHYAGMVCDMDNINRISEEFNIPVIEDNAHAFGSKYNGKFIANNSKYTCFSFQAIKLLTTIDGGMLFIKDASEAELQRARKLRWFGLDKKVPRLENDIKYPGYKYHMNNVNATVGLVQLKYIKDVINRHVENGKYFDEKLKGLDGVETITYYANTEPVYWLYTLKVKNRDEFIKMMENRGIMASQLHHRSDTHSVFAESKTSLPHLDRFYEEYVHIPCGWWVTDEDRENIVEGIKKGW